MAGSSIVAVLWAVCKDAVPVIEHVFAAHGQIDAHGQHGHVFLEQILDLDGTAQLGPALKHCKHAAYGEFNHEIGCEVKMFGVSLQHADHLQSAEIAQGFSQFQRAVRAGQQSQSVETLALFRVGERGGDTFAPLLLGVAVRVGVRLIGMDST